jgi:sugar phosphate isomerase/epimerase
MKIGAMNNPRVDIAEALAAFSAAKFDFIDLTLEYPKAHIDVIDRQQTLKAIKDSGLGVVGHTTYYLPFASPIGSVRQAAIEDVMKTLSFFKEAGAKTVTVHPDSGAGAMESKTTLSLNSFSFKIISDEAAKHDLTVLVENVPGVYSSVEALGSILGTVPALRFHLDVGHAFIRGNKFRQLLGVFKDKLMHVHLSDNRTREDDHMPIGAGNINWVDVIQALKSTGYDSNITLEVFSNDQRYLLASRDKVIELWNAAGGA